MDTRRFQQSYRDGIPYLSPRLHRDQRQCCQLYWHRTNWDETDKWKLQNGRLFHKFTSRYVGISKFTTHVHTETYTLTPDAVYTGAIMHRQTTLQNTHLRRFYTVAHSRNTHTRCARRPVHTYKCRRAFNRHDASAGTTTVSNGK